MAKRKSGQLYNLSLLEPETQKTLAKKIASGEVKSVSSAVKSMKNNKVKQVPENLTPGKGKPEAQSPSKTGNGSGVTPKAIESKPMPVTEPVEAEDTKISTSQKEAALTLQQWIERITQAAEQLDGWDFVLLMKNPAHILGSDMSEAEMVGTFRMPRSSLKGRGTNQFRWLWTSPARLSRVSWQSTQNG